MPSVHVAGSINMDVVLEVDRRPSLGETVVGNGLRFVLGGKGANQAIAAARLGADVTLIGKVGEDGFGEELLERLAREERLVADVGTVADLPTGTAVITVDGDGGNSIVFVPGSNMAVEGADVAGREFRETDVAVSQFEIPQATIRAFFDAAVAGGAHTVLNPAPAAAFEAPILPLVDYLIVNESEAVFYADGDRKPPLTPDQALAICGELRVDDDQVVVVTLGDRGVVAEAPNGAFTLEAHAVDPVDTTGAGDAFVGAFATGIGEGSDLERTLAFANAAGAAATTSLGASRSLPDRGRVREVT